ncbi:MAG: hypothetical protein A3D75_01590 [Candidatus Levybacteria bacterium RIFCSPHIGHO2_02_FULL_37_18]|nr:MAG: hypothetical protein A3D75_01590 [Candidatus Levybacteria bacterium RIFCSPHIGHO2_02_FULL_37_18]OGH33266.1 MAG: hypothetical protein A3A47_03030 [Candidatus Levybacteria bacterium RIFCSPLOWO2_01_FULL_37_20]HLD38456.1 hypothetical protein [Candidatus Nanoarchaeia archaeon]
MIPQNFKKYFWDTDFNSLNIEKHKKYIIERILELGDDEAVKWLNNVFKKDEIINTLKTSRTISRKSLNFWNLIINAESRRLE